jgi:hypothetical protein
MGVGSFFTHTHNNTQHSPSEIPRRLLGERGPWRELMARTRSVAVRLAKEGRIDITQRRAVVAVDREEEIRGPIRLRAAVGVGDGKMGGKAAAVKKEEEGQGEG